MAKSSKNTKLREWQEKAKAGLAECEKCHRKDHITVDHIIPHFLIEVLCIEKDERQNDDENFQFLCRWCNKFKGANLDHLNPKTAPLLRKYTERFIENCI